MKGLVSDQWRNHYAVKQKGVNSAFSYNFGHAIAGTYPTFTINYAQVLISRGSLPNVLGPAVTSGANSIVTFSWTDNSGVSTAKATDLAVLVAYCPAMQQAIFSGGEQRTALTGALNLVSFSGQLVETYIGFMSADQKNIAISIYTGQITVS